MSRRILIERTFLWVMRLSAILVFGGLVSIVVTMLVEGLPSLSWEMITSTPKGGYYLGKEGGVLNAIAGSFYLAIGATLLAVVIALPMTIYLNIYAQRRGRITAWVRSSLDVLYGIPSIVYGAFGFVLMLALGMQVSLLAGIIVVGLLVIPIVARTMDEVMMTVRPELREASFALGATRWETAIKVIARQCLPGLATAALLGFGRAIGDAASVMFTAGFTDNVPTSLTDPAATLPLAIFFQLSSPIPEVRARAHAAALILTLLILLISLLSRLLAKRFSKHIIG